MTLAEVKAAQALVQATELRDDAAFQQYLDAVDLALDCCQNSKDRLNGLTVLGRLLAIARSALEGDVSTLAAWLVVVRSSNPKDDALGVPLRFIAQSPSQPEWESDGSELMAWLDLDGARS